MRRSIALFLVVAVATPLLRQPLVQEAYAQVSVEQTTGVAAAEAAVPVNAEREAYFGDLHLHTTYSFDAYVLMGSKATPDNAYQFARGETIDFLGAPIRNSRPLDFLSVTDHAENMGVANQLEDPNSAFSQSEFGKILGKGASALPEIVKYTKEGKPAASNTRELLASTWARMIEAANKNYQPGKFTTFIGYEWTSMPGGANLHRNVIFAGNAAPTPFTAQDSQRPEDLWIYLTKIRAQGHEAIAIPHNSNASNGLMYDWAMSDGRPIDEGYAQLRALNEPLMEISQNKGTSETHPSLSPDDEFGSFEIFDRMLVGGIVPSKPSGSYFRESLGRGMILGSKLGVNPFKDGVVGGSDLHGALSIQSEKDYYSVAGINQGAARPSKERVRRDLRLDPSAPVVAGADPIIASAGALTGVWAEANTRAAIYAALRRKETFATSGTRIKLRFFGGWSFARGLTKRVDWVRAAYEQGVAMGSDLPDVPNAKVPSFAIQAVKDADSGNLDRIQVIKVWLENGQQRERVFDVAWSGKRRIDAATGKLPAVGNGVDLSTGTYANDIGAAELSTVWSDPAFRRDQPAVYYVRVFEIPTPRWSTLRAIDNDLPLPKDAPATIQERAWSSPIWYTPAS